MNLSSNNNDLLKYFEDFLSKQKNLLYGVQTPVHKACRYALSGQGKRIRPLLVLLSNKACQGSIHDALPAALAIEMIHTYSLIHDDLPCMDDDDLRRGRPTVHVEFDECTALLAGDALLTDAFKMALSANLESQFQVEVIKTISEVSGGQGMVLGQDQDIFWTGKKNYLAENLNFIHEHKTGKLIAGACKIGALTAQTNAPQSQALYDFGLNLGIAFQIIDDILDSHQGTGKSAGKDAEQGKLTYLSVMSIDEAKKIAQKLTDNAFESLTQFGSSADDLLSLGKALLSRTI